MLKLVVLVSGGGTNLQAIIDAIDAGKITNVEIAAVVSNNPKAYALERAKKKGIPVEVVSRKDHPDPAEFDDALLAAVEKYDPGLVVLAGCMVVIPKKMVETFKNRMINIHPALIPSFCGTGFYGLRPHEAVLKRGVKVTGATVHFVDDGTDTGPIILQKAVYVQEGDTAEILQRRVMEQAEWIIMPKAIDLIANGKVRVEDGIVHISEKVEL